MDDVAKTKRINLLQDAPAASSPKIKPKTQMLNSMHLGAKSKTPEAVIRSTYHDFLQYLYDAVLVTGPTGKIVDFNERSSKLFQYEKNEFTTLHVSNVISGANDSLLNTLCSDLEEKRFTVLQAYCIRKDGSYFPAEIAVNNLKLGTMQLSFFVRDITIRKHAEETLKTEHNALQNAWSGIAILNMKNNIVYANPAFARIMGYQLQEVLTGKNITELVEDKNALKQLIETSLSDPQTWSIETYAIKNDNTKVAIQIFATCNLDTENTPTGVVLSCANITERKQLEFELEKVKKELAKQNGQQPVENNEANDRA